MGECTMSGMCLRISQLSLQRKNVTGETDKTDKTLPMWMLNDGQVPEDSGYYLLGFYLFENPCDKKVFLEKFPCYGGKGHF